ncbi:MAG: LPS export ABC transporter ATP-binding protein [Thermodesulfovibrionales bacterium]|jgi:lipopolysaccharide export system ATP-binding protein
MLHTLEIKDLSKSYGKRQVVRDVHILLRSGEVAGLLGPNGAGKTTTFYMIVGMIRPDTGLMVFDNEDIGMLPMYQRARKGIGYLPQEPSIFRRLTVRQNIQAVLEINRRDTRMTGDEPPINDEVERLIEEFNLSSFADRDGYRLSGGERRRAEIARAIALKPTFMLFDEPFAGIDPIAIIELKKILTYLKEKGLGILITDHNVRETLSITDRAYIINNGSVMAEGSPDQLVNDPSVREAYLGEGFRL